MKKRLSTLALCGVMALSLAACGGGNGSRGSSDKSVWTLAVPSNL